LNKLIEFIKNPEHRLESKQLLALAAPAIMAQFAQMSLGVIDTIMAGRYSAEALAAIAIGVSIFNPIIVFIIGIFLALSPITAQYNGQGNQQGVRQAFQRGLILSVLLAIPSSILLYNLEPILWAIGITPEVIPLANGYLQALVWGLVPLYCFFALRFCNEGMFAAKAVMYCSIAAIPFNMVFNYWFINGGLGVPAMGAVGVGWATVVVWSVMATGLFGYTFFAKRYNGYRLFNDWALPKFKHFSEIFKLGLPMGLGLGMEVALFGAVGLMIGRYSVPDIAGNQIAINISSLAYTISLGLSIAVTARVGYHIGKKDLTQARDTGLIGICFGLLISCLTASVIIIFDQQLAAMFTNDPVVSTVAVQLLAMAALFQLSDGIQVNASGALRGMKDTKVPMYICAIAYWLIGFPVGYVLAEHYGMGVTGYWVALISGLSVSAVLMTHRFFSLTK